MEQQIALSIIIATYNRAPFLGRTLESLTQQSLDTALWEVVVVNNNSTDNTDEVVERFGQEHPQMQLKCIHETKQGLSYARNCGINNSTGRYIAIIDDDEETNTLFAESYYNFFEQYPDVAACGGVITPRYDYPLPRWASTYAQRPIAGTLHLGDRIRPFPKNKYPGGGNIGFRRSALVKYGLFNPLLGRTGSTPMGGEEKDLLYRMRQGGEKIYYIPEAIIYHIIPESRFSTQYFEQLNYMGGRSERVRTRALGRWAFFKRLVAEGIKWAATLALLMLYMLRLQPLKGIYLVKMRWQISKGLIGN